MRRCRIQACSSWVCSSWVLDPVRRVTYFSGTRLVWNLVSQVHPMKKMLSHLTRNCTFFESLENRTLLCGTAASAASSAALKSAERSAVVETANAVKNAATKTTLAATTGTLGQPITFTVTVRAAAASGAPTGTVNIIDRGNVLRTLTLSPATSTDSRYAISQANYTFNQEAGAGAYFIGKHPFSATFVPSGAFAKSSGHDTVTVSKPTYTPLSDGVEIETILPGSGPGIASGQTADVLYTGYLAKSGKIFDDSVNDGDMPYTFTLGAGSVIVGFDEGTVGMQVGESRLILIPPAEGYGSKANGPIPGKSTLLFEITLESIS